MRADGRKSDELRKIRIKLGVVEKADGSAEFKIGDTWAIASVYGPRTLHPRHLERPGLALLRCHYDLAPFSTPERKERRGRREVELSMMIRQALEPAIFFEEFPRAAIDVYIEVLNADAGTRCASICAASLALAEAGISMKDLVSAVAVGRVGGEIVVDLTSEEEKVEGADMPIAYMPKEDLITLLQMDGKLTIAEFRKAIALGIGACREIHEMMQRALKEKYGGRRDGGSEEISD